MTPSSYDIPLHDIQPLMEVPDSSFAFLVIVVLVVVVLISSVLYLLFGYFKKQKKINIRKEHFKALKKVDFKDPKKAAYQITFYGRLFSDDSERMHEAYNNMVDYLEDYKYKKSVAPINDESRSYYKIYLEMIDV